MFFLIKQENWFFLNNSAIWLTHTANLWSIEFSSSRRIERYHFCMYMCRNSGSVLKKRVSPECYDQRQSQRLLLGRTLTPRFEKQHALFPGVRVCSWSFAQLFRPLGDVTRFSDTWIFFQVCPVAQNGRTFWPHGGGAPGTIWEASLVDHTEWTWCSQGVLGVYGLRGFT